MSLSNIVQDTLLNANPLMQATNGDKQMASNHEITKSIDELRRVLREQRLNNPEIDAKGDHIIYALDNFLNTSESCIRDKNSDEELQKFVNNAITFSEHAKKEAEINMSKFGSASDASNQQVINIANNLKHTVYQLFTSSDMRTTLRDVEGVFQKFVDVFEQYRNEHRRFADIPDEKRKELIKSILSIYSKSGKASAVKELRSEILSLYDYWRSKKETVSESLQKEFSELFDQALRLINRFTESDIFEVKSRAIDVYKKLENDRELEEFARSMRNWIDDLAKSPESADSEENARKGDELLKKGMDVIDKHYDSLKVLLEDIKQLLRSLQREEYLNKFKDDVKEIGRSLKGSYLDTLIQLRTVLAPIIENALNGMKLGKIEHIDESSRWKIIDPVFDAKESSLRDVSVNFKIGLQDIVEVTLKVKNIDIRFKDVTFAYEKTSMPSWSDSGKLDFRVASPGWKLKWVVKQRKDQDSTFELKEVRADIKTLDVSFTKADHTLIDSLFIKLWTPSLKKRARESIENILREKSVVLTGSLNKFFVHTPEGSSQVSVSSKGVQVSEVKGDTNQVKQTTQWTA
eukprot:TRINITY_DN1997_c0_g1_i1.p1 TRINITY_DN1997_c0_g1~~TRINITY_DN1997_c0_g1_i1.p1  ORF type:complete len:585 (-),score=308.26 TRINITY_DN1997_c0_g1_i1:78-1805(-)